MTQTTVQPPTVLRQLIDDRGIRHVWLAERLGVTRSHFTRLLNRERGVTSQAIETLSGVLGVPVAAFFDGNELILSSCTSTNDLPLAGAQDTPGRGQSVNGREEDVA